MEPTNVAFAVASLVTGIFLGWWIKRQDEGKIDFLVQQSLKTHKKLNKIMAADQEILAALAEADAATNEIAEDIAALVAREPNLSQETKDALAAHVAKLKGVASQYTPEGTEEPGEEPVV